MKRILIVAAAMMSVSHVLAQDAPPAAKTTLEFDAQQLQWLSQAISELPKKIADPFLAELQRQLTVKQAAEKAKADAAKNAAPAKK